MGVVHHMICITYLLQESLLHMEVVDDALLCGARFLNPEGTDFAVTAYDSSSIYTFTKLSAPPT